MPSPIPLPIREAIIDRHRRNQDAATIARALHLRPRTVRHLIRRFRQRPDAIPPSYRPGSGRPKDAQELHDQAVALREEHPTWGGGIHSFTSVGRGRQKRERRGAIAQ